MADRGEVKIRQGKLADLIRIYRAAYKDLTLEIIDATDAGKIQKARTMASIKQTLRELGDDVDTWVKAEIPQYYLDGANVAAQDLKSMGVDLRKPGGLQALNKESIKILTDEVSLAFAEGITGIGRNAARVLDNALKQQLNFIIAEGKLKGEALKTISQAVQAQLRRDGLSVLVDRAGKRWEFETYSNMLVRTKAVEARNLGLTNRMLANGYDLVQVSNHNSKHAECARWESKILSLTGQSKGRLPGGVYVAGTVEKAKAQGLFHPNCQHAINVINPELAAKTKAYDNPFNRRTGV